MEDRQRQIREGAGLEESRLNVEFIDFLRKYSTPILVVIAVIAGGYAGYNYLKRQRDKALDTAFVELESAVAARSVKSLEAVAQENAGRAAVPVMARLHEADLHLEAYRSGIKPGIQGTHDPNTDELKLPEGEKFLTEEERAAELSQAAALYKIVADQTEHDEHKTLFAIGALEGLASVAESRGQIDEARAAYQKVIERAKAAGFDGLVAAAQKRIDTLEQVKTLPRLYARAELPVKETVIPMGGIKATTPEGGTLTFQPDPENPAKLIPVPDPSNPAPAPTPLPPPPAEPTPAPAQPSNPSPPSGETPKP